ncbi:MAG: hypothetical protein ACP6IU_02205 [Candidatus Asgardarchaeia archaeon]
MNKKSVFAIIVIMVLIISSFYSTTTTAECKIFYSNNDEIYRVYAKQKLYANVTAIDFGYVLDTDTYVAVVGSAYGIMSFWTWGTYNFSWIRNLALPGKRPIVDMQIYDVNNDSKNELLVLTSNALYIFRVSRYEYSMKYIQFANITLKGLSIVNLEGYPRILISTNSSIILTSYNGTHYIYTNRTIDVDNIKRIRVLEMNNYTFVATSNETIVYIYEFHDDNFTELTSFEMNGEKVTAISFDDINQDNNSELIVATSEGHLDVYSFSFSNNQFTHTKRYNVVKNIQIMKIAKLTDAVSEHQFIAITENGTLEIYNIQANTLYMIYEIYLGPIISNLEPNVYDINNDEIMDLIQISYNGTIYVIDEISQIYKGSEVEQIEYDYWVYALFFAIIAIFSIILLVLFSKSKKIRK